VENMKTIKSITILFVVLCLPLFGQTFSLKQCIEYAKQNNSNIKIAYLDADVSGKVVNEQVGKALPQIDFSGSVEDKLKITTSILPGELMGKPGTFIPVKMGTKYNVSAGLSLTQKIFDPSFWVALKAAKISETMSEQNIQKTDEQTIYDVGTAYYRASIIKKQLENLQIILDASERTLKSTELKYQNGLAKKIDVDKIKVSYNNTNTQVQQTELSYNQALNNLKYYMGMPVDSSIVLTETLPDYTEASSQTSTNENFVENRVDYQIQKTNVALYEADKQNNISAYLPSLSFYANYNYQAMRSDFDFFKSGKDWYNSSAIGLELKIPIFSGFQRYSRVEQSQLNIEKAIENLKLTEQSIKVELSNYYIQFRNAIDNIQNEKENLALAENVYKNTQLEFSQGSGSSLDLVQTESSLRETQNNYYNKLLTLYIAKLDLEKSQGTLINFINNLK
jgi:outer membrane protein TolC